MSVYSAVDLSKLPAPSVVEALDFETILAAMLADLRSRDDQFDTLSEADPAYKVLEVAAYRELILRARVNDSARAVMLAYAAGPDLDNIVAREPYNVARLLIDAGDAEATPPVPPTYESDDALRRRAQLAPSRFSTAGPEAAYIFHALSADPRVLDASATSPTPGTVVVTVMSVEGDGTASDDLLAAVTAALTAAEVRPLTDNVIIQGAEIVPYTLEAELTLYPGPDSDVVLATANARLATYQEKVRRLGLNVSRSGLAGALHCEGVEDVDLSSPADNISIAPHQVSSCTGSAVTIGGRDE